MESALGLAWNHGNSTLIPYCRGFKFHIPYAEAGYQLWNYVERNLYGTESHLIRLWKKCGIKVELTDK